MKKIFVIAIGMIFLLSSFFNDNYIEKFSDYKFEATVLGKGIDCDDVFLINLKGLEADSEFDDGTYYADKLKPEFKLKGLNILLNCRKPTEDELYSCTCKGPGYSHVIVLECETINLKN